LPERRKHPFQSSQQRTVEMDSWYMPAIPAALAFAIIGYSVFLAYA
jgi:hypothetical protein